MKSTRYQHISLKKKKKTIPKCRLIRSYRQSGADIREKELLHSIVYAATNRVIGCEFRPKLFSLAATEKKPIIPMVPETVHFPTAQTPNYRSKSRDCRSKGIKNTQSIKYDYEYKSHPGCRRILKFSQVKPMDIWPLRPAHLTNISK